MTEQLVPTVRTTPTMVDFARAILRVWPDAQKASAGILWAHFAGETGDGAHCYGWNLGNVKYTRGCGLDYQALRGVWEIDRATSRRIELTPSDPGSWFRVYPSLDAAMLSFVESKRTGQWRSAWTFVVNADPDGYARELSRLRYYTAPVQTYVNSMRAKLAAWMRSSAFEDARADFLAAQERETEPELVDPPSEPTIAEVVYPELERDVDDV